MTINVLFLFSRKYQHPPLKEGLPVFDDGPAFLQEQVVLPDVLIVFIYNRNRYFVTAILPRFHI